MTKKKTKASKKAGKKSASRRRVPTSESTTGTAKFPYTNKPGSLRKFLEEAPRKPRPDKVNKKLLQSWGLRDTNDQSIIRVLKSVDLVSQSNVPTDKYTEFMNLASGPQVLGVEIRRVYELLFQASHEPYRESAEVLQNLFNIHSGGSTISLQIQTFKALCDFAKFDGGVNPGRPAGRSGESGGVGSGTGGHQGSNRIGPMIHIDLHIHLPENKSRRDYEYMFEDIARYIYRQGESSDDDQS